MSQTTLFRNYRRSRLFIAVAIVFAATAFGAIGFWLIEGWSIIDSLYMTVMTLTTVGFGEVHPLSTGGRLFTILLMLMGVGAVTFAFATVLQVVVKSEIKTGLNVVVVSIQRPNGEAVFNPTGDFVFEPGDIIFAIGSDEDLDHLRIRASGQVPEL